MEIDEKKLREILAEQQEETKRYLGALREDSEHQIEAVAEQYLGLSGKVDTLAGTVGTLHDTVDTLSANVNTLTSTVDTLVTTVNEMQNTLEDVKRVGEATFEEVGNLAVAQTEIQETLKNHEKRITVLER